MSCNYYGVKTKPMKPGTRARVEAGKKKTFPVYTIYTYEYACIGVTVRACVLLFLFFYLLVISLYGHTTVDVGRGRRSSRVDVAGGRAGGRTERSEEIRKNETGRNARDRRRGVRAREAKERKRPSGRSNGIRLKIASVVGPVVIYFS